MNTEENYNSAILCCSIMKLVAALFLMFVGTANSSPVENLEIVFPDDKAADFEVKLSGQAWLKSGPVALRNGDDWCSSDDGLKLDNVDNVRWDDYVVRTFTWVSSKNASYKTTTYLKMYTNHPVVVFGQVFDTGAAAGSKDGENNQLRSSFPTFQDAGADLGSIVFGGGQVNEAKTERWPKSSLSSSEEGSFPVVLFDEAMENAIVLSPLNTFMSSLQATWKTSPGQEVFGFGIMDSVNEIPEEYAYETVLVAGQNVTDTMMKWGKFMQRFYNRDDSYRYSDYTINYLGYWTDNGACYHYCTGKYDNYEDALVDMKKYSDQQGIPYRYLQLDSWWYYKGTSDGVKNWTAMTTVFPHGLSYIADVWKTPIVAHNRMWSQNTDYAKQNGGKYDFIVNGNLALPTEYSFWLDLMGNASRDWNLLVYEQDWLSTEYRGLKNLTTDLNLGRQWLMQMGNAARSQDLTIQYCMSFVRHLLQAVEIPVVTQIRVSGDYHPSNTNWQIGDSTILADSLGIAAFKDNFHSVKVEADCCKLPTTENAPELEATVAALSRGPVGIGDQVGGSDKELIMATCMTDGRLLKPTHPSKSLDSTFVQRAFGSNGPAGQLYAAYTEVSIAEHTKVKGTFL